MLYQIRYGTVSLQGEVILDHIHFEIKGKEKIALVGENGTGKTTLLKVISGELSLDLEEKYKDSGIRIARNTTIGMLPQEPWKDPDTTLECEISLLCRHLEAYSKERFDFEQEYDRLLTGFGFAKEDKYRKIHTFSGGQQTKLAMIQLLLQKPDILILDEPTNHLDEESVSWLEEYICQYPHAVLYVSHDRFFIDQTADVVYEISKKQLKKYAGNYSQYRETKEIETKAQYKLWKAQQEEKERLGQTIERFKHKPTKAAMARSKKKMLSRMKEVEKPDPFASYIYPEAIVPEKAGSKNVLECQKLTIGYQKPLREFNFTLRRGQKIGILGKNGSGKSTLLKTILGHIPALAGTVRMGNGIEIGYFDQLSQSLPLEKRVLQYVQDCFPAWTGKEIRGQLSRYHFDSQDCGKQIGDLSGGEKAKLALCLMLARKPNLLILDEPTNHMDIPSIEVIESALQAYTGSILFVTHDRYFLKKVASSLLLFEEVTTFHYAFSYEHYLQMKQKKADNIARGIFTLSEENKALLDSYEAVPVKKKMQAQRMSTEQAYTDWQLDLAKKDLEEKGEELFSHLSRKYEEDLWNNLDLYIIWQELLQKKWNTYTDCCLFWYDKYLDYEIEFKNYKDNS